MKVAIGADHRGVILKGIIIEYLKNLNIDYEDCGVNSTNKVDYPIIATKVCKLIQKNNCELGILICGTGLGVAITANKYRGIRCANCYNEEMAKYAKLHNNANILALGAGQTDEQNAKKIVKIWLETEFQAGRHLERINMIAEIEKENMK